MLTPFSDFKTTEISLENINEYFVKPQNMHLVFTPNATFIEGQRGTGKTMLMRYIENNPQCDANGMYEYMGVYFRFDRFVFGIKKLSESKDLFYHLLTISLFCLLTERLKGILADGSFVAMNKYVGEICHTFFDDNECIEQITDFDRLLDYLENKRLELMKHLRNSKRVERPIICDYGTCFSRVINAIRSEKIFSKITVLFLFDEFENLNSEQQAMINGMIKSAENGFTYKVFHRPFGRESSQVLDSREYLKERDDYTVMDLYKDIIGGDKCFREFVKQIIRVRLKVYYRTSGVDYCEKELEIEKYLENLTVEEEFQKLSNEKYIGKLKQEIHEALSTEERIELSDFLCSMSNDVFQLRLYKSLIAKNADKLSPIEIANHFIQNTDKYKNWVHNYRIAILYLAYHENGEKRCIAGFDQIIQISDGIVRYVLNILHYTFINQKAGKKYVQFSAEEQSSAISKVAVIAFDDIINIPNVGRKVSDLIRYFGEIFQWYHQDEMLRKWETNHVTIHDSVGLDHGKYEELQNVLLAAVTWGQLSCQQATKMKSKKDFALRDTAYCLHPIFSVFFNISWRKKQKCEVSAVELYQVLFEDTKTHIETKKKRYDSVNNSVEGFEQIAFEQILS